jgi:hypothetical protein
MQLEILSEWCAVSGREKHWSPQISLAFTIFSAQFNCIVPALGEGEFGIRLHRKPCDGICRIVAGRSRAVQTLFPLPAGEGKG